MEGRLLTGGMPPDFPKNRPWMTLKYGRVLREPALYV